MYRFHRYNLIRWDISSPSVAYKLFVRGLYDYVIVKEETSSSVTTRSYFVASKGIEASWSNRASLTYSEDIQGRKLLNEGQNWLAAAIGQITELLTGVNYRVEDYPLVWIEDTYYTTYKDDIFQVSVKTDVPTQAEYDAVTDITLSSQSLTTDFTNTLLSKFTNLDRIVLTNNSISILDLSNLTKLLNIQMRNNSISVLDISNLISLFYLDAAQNNLTTIYTSVLNSSISYLSLYDNNLTSIDLSIFSNAVTVYLQENNFTSLNTTNLAKVADLRVHNNTSLQNINCLNLVDLSIFFAYNCAFTDIDLTNSTKLTSLDLTNNSLTNLVLPSSTTNLRILRINGNSLTTLNVLPHPALNNLRINDNQFDNLVNSQILIDLDTNGQSNGVLVSSIFGGGSLTAAGQTAKANLQAKGWNIIGI